MSSNHLNNNKSVQYASSTPSISSILNLPTVGDKDKKKVAGLVVGKPKTSIAGLKPTSLGLKQSSVTLLKTPPVVKETKSPVIVTEAKEASSSIAAVSSTEKLPCKETTKKPSSGVDPGAAKVEKSVQKKQSNVKTHSHSHKQVILPPHDHFDPSHWRLFVGNLGPEVSDSLLLNTFSSQYPSCSRVLIVKDWKSQKSKGFGFVAFADGREFLRALKEMNGKWIGNRQCIIKKSEHQPATNTKS